MSDFETQAAEEVDVALPTPENFSMFDLIEAIEYPTDEVTVALNEKAAHDLGALAREIDDYMAVTDDVESESSKERLAEYRNRLDALQAKIEKSRVTFYLKGVPDDLVAGANDVVEERFADAKKQVRAADGRLVKVLPEDQKIPWMRYLNAVINSLHIERVYYHANGATVTAPSPDEVAFFYDRAPAAAQGILSARIQGLRVSASEYERDFDEGFFPKS